MQSKRQLFEGQTNHPLSEEEKQAFWKKISFSGRLLSFGDERKMRRGLEAMMEIPTGREQIRQIINSPQKEYKITSRGDAFLKKKNCRGMCLLKSNIVLVNSDYLNNTTSTGEILLHELLHCRQKKNPHFSKLFFDTETQALSAQIALETGNKDSKDVSYGESYNINLKKWTAIATGQKQKPIWAPPLKYTFNLTSEEKKEARFLYAHQMAAMETRTQYMEDFFTSRTRLIKGNHSLPIYSYDLLNMQLNYDGNDIGYFTPPTPALINDLKARYPSLNKETIMQSTQELIKEHRKLKEAPPNTPQEKAQVHEEIAINPAFVPELEKEFRHIKKFKEDPRFSKEEKFQKWVDWIEKDNKLNHSQKIKFFALVIAKSKNEQPKPNPDRKKIIEKAQEITGLKTPIVLATPQQQNQVTLSLEKNLLAQNNETNATDPSRDANTSSLLTTLKTAQEQPYADGKSSAVFDNNQLAQPERMV